MGVVLSSRKPPKSAFPLTGLQHKYHPGRTVHCFQNIWFNKRTHPHEHRNGYWLSTKCVLASDQSSVKPWLVQPIKELSTAAELCAGRGCALIRQLANSDNIQLLLLAGWANSTTWKVQLGLSARLFVCLCVCVLTRVAQIITAIRRD